MCVFTYLYYYLYLNIFFKVSDISCMTTDTNLSEELREVNQMFVTITVREMFGISYSWGFELKTLGGGGGGGGDLGCSCYS